MVENIFRGESSGLALDVRLSSGPLKGIYTDINTANRYDAMIRDLAVIKEETAPSDKVLICNLAPLYYLYLDRSYATYSTWYRKDEFYRLEAYWEEHPERIPDVIYLSYFDMFTYTATEKGTAKKMNDILAQYFELEISQGEAGEIFRVIRQKPTS